jgi:hypothetical protein
MGATGILLLAAGCHTGRSGDATLLERIERARHSRAAPKPGVLAEKALVAITDECAKQSYETASKGLIVSEVGLHEDVFVLRDRVSYDGIGYGLDEAERLEDLLGAEARVGGHPAEQADCIQEFAERLEALSDPLVEADQRQKELDVSAFDDSAKHIQAQAEKRPRGADTLIEPKAPSSELLPQ